MARRTEHTAAKNTDYLSWVLVIATLLMCLLAWGHFSAINGPYYWKWPWRRLEPLQWLAMMVSAIPALAAILWFRLRPFEKPWMFLLLLSVASLTMKLGSVLSQDRPVGWTYFKSVTWSPAATSYFVDAVRVVSTVRQGQEPPLFWLQKYDQIVRTPPPGGFNLHTATKPVGPLALYIGLVSVFGSDAAAVITSGITLMLLSLISLPAVYWCIHKITGQSQIGLLAAAMVAVSPGFILFPTKLDALWIGLGAMTIGTWYLALSRSSWWQSLALGCWLSLMLLVGFQQLTLGLFMALMPAAVLLDRPLVQRYRLAARMGLPSIALAVGIHVLLAMSSGYNSWKVFQANVFVQGQLMQQPILEPRQAPWTTAWDLYDFALGGGWVLALVFCLGLFNRQLDRSIRMLGWSACVLMGVIAVLALIPAETARCWLFLSIAPLILIASEAGRWDRKRQGLLLGCVLLSTVVIHGTMAFILP